MTSNLERTIRTAVKSILANTDLSDYRINKIVKTELSDPASWGAEGDKETCIRRYYENIHSMNVFINFTNRLHARYGICYEAHRQRTAGDMEKFTYKGVRFLPNAIRYIEADPTRLDTIKAAIDRMDERERPYSYVSAGESSFCIFDY